MKKQGIIFITILFIFTVFCNACSSTNTPAEIELISINHISLSELNSQEKQNLISKLQNENPYPTVKQEDIDKCMADYLSAYLIFDKDLNSIKDIETNIKNIKSNKNIRVFDGVSENWIWTYDEKKLNAEEKKLANAQKNLELDLQIICAAQLNMNITVEGLTYINIVKLIKEDSFDIESVNEIIDKYIVHYNPLPSEYMGYDSFPEYHNDEPEYVSKIKNIIKTNTGVSI